MAREAESGAYVGGISTMLAQSDVCASCGRIHPGRAFGLLGAKSECPTVVFGSLPALTGSIDADDLIPSSPYAGSPRRSPLHLLDAPPLPLPVPAPARKSHGLTVPWPMPSHLEDYL
jgi:hypothetical protein